MLGNKNLNESIYTSSDYTRLSDGIPPYHYNQNQPYNKHTNNKPFINQPDQNESLNNPANQAH